MPQRHAFESAVTDDADPDLVGPDEWNAPHIGVPDPIVGWPSSFSGGGDTDFTLSAAGNYTPGSGSAGTISLFETNTSITRYQYTATGLLVQTGTGIAQQHTATHTIADGNFIVAYLAPGHPVAGDNMIVGLRLANAGAETITLMLEQDTTSYDVQANSDSNGTGVTLTGNRTTPRSVFFAVARQGLSYSTWVSWDGGSWRRVFAETFSGEMTEVRLLHQCHSTAPTVMPITRWLFVKETTPEDLISGTW